MGMYQGRARMVGRLITVWLNRLFDPGSGQFMVGCTFKVEHATVIEQKA